MKERHSPGEAEGRSPSRSRGFTLGELLSVMAIVAILAAILFPVFARTLDKARANQCLSNCRQIGVALMLYAQDNEEGLPMTSHGGEGLGWLATLQPYVTTELLYRCPSDASDNWESPLPDEERTRTSSYAINAHLTPQGGFDTLASVAEPTRCIYLAELADNRTGDHIHPHAWPRPGYDGRTIEPQAELALRRHQGRAIYVFMDGHAQACPFEQTWNPPMTDWYYPG